MGHVISCGLDLISSGKGIHTDQELKSSMLSLKGLAARSNITNRERLHVKAVKEWAKGYPHGMYAFGLIETGFYKKAEKHAGLELSPRDCWSTHAEAHVIEMEGRQDDGIKVLSTTLNDWTGEHQAALDIYDEEVGKRCHSGAMLDLVDASSLLYTLQMEANEITRTCRCVVFNDVHVLMCTMGAKKEDATLTLMMSLRDFVRDGSGTNCEVPRESGTSSTYSWFRLLCIHREQSTITWQGAY
ncbi:tetratricopeptide repeat protein 38-like isoform X2 [Stylophora pistillata]|uniref:tetratricopeptide repeat protein 38-like isoform X2 n=1 Tax=Stylophora pistillata TaxID=50429 RepID=UPI000C04B765|nr:tetratricopeptide repeat protein 38-like isoform X2 [Stylophora pistillata]